MLDKTTEGFKPVKGYLQKPNKNWFISDRISTKAQRFLGKELPKHLAGSNYTYWSPADEEGDRHFYWFCKQQDNTSITDSQAKDMKKESGSAYIMIVDESKGKDKAVIDVLSLEQYDSMKAQALGYFEFIEQLNSPQVPQQAQQEQQATTSA